MKKQLKVFSVLTTVGMVFVLLGGALVTKTDSGMGCGRSWPLCHGKLIPDDITAELIIEWTHRLISGIVGLMVLILAVWTWKTIKHIRETKFLAFLAVFFLILQSLLGAAAVIWDQSDLILAGHFGISLISFATVFLLTMLVFESDKRPNTENLHLNKKMRTHTIGVTVYSFIVVYTGALVRHIDAGLACKDWPFCVNSAIAWPGNLQEWVQMGHRFTAGMLLIWIGYITFLAIKNFKQQKLIYWGWITAFILIILQIAAGAVVVLTRIDLIVSLAHAFFITCLFGLLSYFVLLSSRSRKREKYREETPVPPPTISAAGHLPH